MENNSNSMLNGYEIKGRWDWHKKNNVSVPEPIAHLLKQVAERLGYPSDINAIRHCINLGLKELTGIDVLKIEQTPTETKISNKL